MCISKSVNDICRQLPEGWHVILIFGNHGASIQIVDPQGTSSPMVCNIGLGIHSGIDAAVQLAIKKSKDFTPQGEVPIPR